MSQAYDPDGRVGFLLVAMGGTGRDALRTVAELFQADGRPFDKLALYADTEPGTIPAADVKLELGLKPADVAVIQTDPAAIGPVAGLVVRHYPSFLKPESIINGSRTTRLLTQLAVEYHFGGIVECLGQCIRDTARSMGASSAEQLRPILPVFFGSSGGGTGSALIVLLARHLADPWFRARITEGLSASVLLPPVAVVAEPFAYALRHKPKHAARILANAFAFRIETALLEARSCFHYVIHQGMANAGGAILDTKEEITKVLGTGVYQLCRGWGEHLKPRLVDTVDWGIITDRFTGNAIPENRLAGESRLAVNGVPPGRVS